MSHTKHILKNYYGPPTATENRVFTKWHTLGFKALEIRRGGRKPSKYYEIEFPL